jgi:hypothetical protein
MADRSAPAVKRSRSGAIKQSYSSCGAQSATPIGSHCQSSSPSAACDAVQFIGQVSPATRSNDRGRSSPSNAVRCANADLPRMTHRAASWRVTLRNRSGWGWMLRDESV